MSLILDGTAGVTFPASQTPSMTAYQGGVLTSGTAVASTSGTSIDFTSIPSWVKRITVMFKGVSTNGTSYPIIQVGAGSIQGTGYNSAGGNSPNGSSPGINNSTTSFLLEGGSVMSTAATTRSGIVTLCNITGNIWVLSAVIANTASTQIAYAGGDVTVTGTLDRVRITTVNGTDTFDAGSINIFYE